MTKSDPVTSVGVHEAKTNLSRLLALVESGAEVEIRRGAAPIARLVPFEEAAPRRIGFASGAFEVPDDFDDEDADLTELFSA
jgi:antitoxin (DNA-binding transcriptional repressor) of toxin-antitoxin stability system